MSRGREAVGEYKGNELLWKLMALLWGKAMARCA